MSSYKKFTKDIGLIGVVNFLVVVRSIIFVPLITKLLGAFDYGIWVQLLITITLIAPLIRLGLTNSLVRYLAAEKDKEEIKEGIYSTVFLTTAISIIVTLILILFISPFAKFIQAPVNIIAFLPFIILFECLNNIFFSVFQAFQEMKKYSLLMILNSLGEISLVAGSIILGYGLKGAVASLLITRLIIFILSFSYIYKRVGFKIPNFSGIKKYLSFGLPTLLSGFSYLLVTSADKYIVGFFLGTLFVGYYAPAYSLGNVITFLILPISFVLFPAVCKSYDENRIDEVKTKLRYSLKYFLLLAIPAVFGLSILSKELLKIFSTAEIMSYSFFVTPFVASSILFYGTSDIFSGIITLVKKTKIIGFVWAVAAILNILLNILLVPFLGILGAAISTFFAYLFALLAIWHYSRKEFTFEIDWLSIFKSLIASLLMAIVVFAVNPKGLFMTIFAVIIGVIFYFVAIILLKGFSKKETEFFKSLLS